MIFLAGGGEEVHRLIETILFVSFPMPFVWNKEKKKTRAATLHLLSVRADLAHDEHAVRSGYSHKSKRKKKEKGWVSES